MRRSRITRAIEQPTEIETGQVSEVVSVRKPFVFVSHDSRDADLAEAFGNLLTDASGGILKSFRSSDKKGTAGIEFGAEWYKSIMSKLSGATDVVALLTQNSLDRPWILYEAGVAKGRLDTTVFGIALGIPLEKASTGPFGQFQNCGDDEDSLTKLVIQLIQKNPDAAPREEAVKRQVKAFCEHVTAILKSRPQKPIKKELDARTAIPKMFEEVKVIVKDLPEKITSRLKNLPRSEFGRRSLFRDPRMAEFLLFGNPFKGSPGGSAISWLVFISAFKDEFPWLFEIGMDLYRAIRSGNPEQIKSTHKILAQSMELMFHGPFGREFIRPENEESMMMLRHFPDFVDEFLRQLGHVEGVEEHLKKKIRRKK